MKKFFSTISLVIISIVVFGQQWNGSTTTENDIYRFGSVSIGINPPTEKFEIKGNLLVNVYENNQIGGIFFRRGFSSISAEPRNISIRIRDYNQEGLTPDGLEINGSDGIMFGTLSQDRMFIDRNGNVGIGTTTPNEKLDINGRIKAAKGVYATGVSNPSTWNANAVDISINGSDGYLRSRDWTANQWLPLYIQASKYLFNDGNIGIGLTDPKEKLDVNGKVKASNGVYATGTSNPTTWDANAVDISISGDNGYLRSRDWTANQWLPLYIQASKYVFTDGNVGIGTTSPNQILDIVGEAMEGGSTESDNVNKYFRFMGKHFDSNEESLCAIMTASSDGINEVLIGGGTSIGNAATRISFYTADNSITTKGTEKMRILANGNVAIGTSETGTHKLAVDGTIGAREIVVEAGTWSDFVFNTDYKLKDLEEVEIFIEENKHLPDIPSEKEVKENGVQVGEMNAKLLQKIEELTLYMIDINKRVKLLEEENKALKEENSILKTQ